jgi:hypothetical protein
MHSLDLGDYGTGISCAGRTPSDAHIHRADGASIARHLVAAATVTHAGRLHLA